MEAIAKVLCYDGRNRVFRADNQGEVLHRTARKYTYSIWAEPEGRGFVTMLFTGNEYVLAEKKYQPVAIEAQTWAGRWEWVSPIQDRKVF